MHLVFKGHGSSNYICKGTLLELRIRSRSINKQSLSFLLEYRLYSGEQNLIDRKEMEFECQKTECPFALASNTGKEGHLGAAGAA